MPNHDYEAIVWVTVDGKESMKSGITAHEFSTALQYLDEISKGFILPDNVESGYVAIYYVPHGRRELQRAAIYRAAKAAAY